MTEARDIQLLRLCAKGDEAAFVQLYRMHQGPVFRFALHMCGSRETAEEITQEVFMNVVTGSLNFEEARGGLQGYLLGIARNCLRRDLRGFRTVRRHLERTEALEPRFADDVSLEQEIHALRQAILRLPTKYREAVVLCDLEGLAYAEAAARLGCAVGTIRSRLHRARNILAAKLRKGAKCLA